MRNAFLHFEMCNFSKPLQAKLLAFSFINMIYFFTHEDIKQTKKLTHRLLFEIKTLDTSLKTTIRGLLVELFEVLSVPRVGQSFSLFSLKFVVSRSDYAGYDVGSFPIGS